MYAIEPVLTHYADKRGIEVKRKMLCPFHEERVPSASVDLDEGLFYCHACGVGGDAIAIIMDQERVGYREAVAIAERLAGPDDGSVSSRQADLGGLLPQRKGNQPAGSRYVPPWLRG